MTRPPGKWWPGIGTAAIALVGLATVASAEGPDREPMTWKVGEAVPIAIRDGKARFRCPTPKPGSRVMIVVSAISRGEGSFPIRIETRSTARGEAPDRSREGPRRQPVITGPPTEPQASAPNLIPPIERIFALLSREGDVASASNYTTIAARLRAVGRRVQVYVDPADEGRVGASLLREIVATCDDRVIPTAEKLWGKARDVDGDGRFTILLSSKLGRLGGGRLAADGFVRGADLDPEFDAPFGNRCDMMYLNSTIAGGAYLRTLLAHEYTHAVTFSRRSFGPDGRQSGLEEEGWLDEAMAHLAEDLHGFSRANIDHRVDAFLADPGHYRLIVGDYYASNLFRSHGHRGAAYLFLRWCVDRHGPDLLSTLICSPTRGVAGLEAATGSTFADLFRGWTTSLALAGVEPRAAAPNRPELPTIDGPRASFVELGGSESWSSPGTASHYAIVAGAPGRAVEVEVVAPVEADLQVTAIPIADDLPRLTLSARTLNPADGKGPTQVSLRLRQVDGVVVRLDTLSWSPLIPPPDASGRGGRIGSNGLASAFGNAEVGTDVTRLSRPIALPNLPVGPSTIVLKLVAADSKGRRVAAWATVEDGGESPW